MFQLITLSKKQTDISCGLRNFEILQIKNDLPNSTYALNGEIDKLTAIMFRVKGSNLSDMYGQIFITTLRAFNSSKNIFTKEKFKSLQNIQKNDFYCGI